LLFEPDFSPQRLPIYGDIFVDIILDPDKVQINKTQILITVTLVPRSHAEQRSKQTEFDKQAVCIQSPKNILIP